MLRRVALEKFGEGAEPELPVPFGVPAQNVPDGLFPNDAEIHAPLADLRMLDRAEIFFELRLVGEHLFVVQSGFEQGAASAIVNRRKAGDLRAVRCAIADMVGVRRRAVGEQKCRHAALCRDLRYLGGDAGNV